MENNYIDNDNKNANESYIRAKKKTEEIKKFYKHLIIYVVVNIIISAVKVTDYLDGGFTLEETFSQLDIYIVWLIWGFFILLRAVKTFKANAILGADWEERKIKEIMNEK